MSKPDSRDYVIWWLTVLAFFLFLLVIKPANACTVFAGMSQTWNTCSHIGRQGGDNFACLINTGDEIETWASGRAWDGARVRINECSGNIYNTATHVAVQLSAPDPNRNTRQRVRELSAMVVQQVRMRFPRVSRITLITSTGGPNGTLCPVRSNMRNTRRCVNVNGTCYVRSSHQYNSQNWFGMLDYASADPDVFVFPSEVCSCNNFSDGKGHLSGRGKRCTADRWLVLLSGSVPEPGPEPEPEPEPEPDPGLCPVAPLPGQSFYNACYNHLGFTKPFTSLERREIKACVAKCE